MRKLGRFGVDTSVGRSVRRAVIVIYVRIQLPIYQSERRPIANYRTPLVHREQLKDVLRNDARSNHFSHLCMTNVFPTPASVHGVSVFFGRQRYPCLLYQTNYVLHPER